MHMVLSNSIKDCYIVTFLTENKEQRQTNNGSLEETMCEVPQGSIFVHFFQCISF